MSDEIKMKKITVYVTLGLVGCKKEETIEVEADMSEEEIDEYTREVMFNMMEWGWYEAEQE